LSLNLDTYVEDAEILLLIQFCLIPLLQILLNYTEDSDADYQEVQHGTTVIGEAWVYIGLLRCQLLIPKVPVDPALRPGVQMKLCRKVMESNSLYIFTSHLRFMLSKQVCVTDSIREMSNSNDSEFAKFKIYEQQAIQRPHEHKNSFRDLFQDVRHSCFHLCDVNKVLSLVKLSKSVLATFKCDFKKASCCQKEMHQLLMDEITWQKSVLAFIKRLESSYPTFNDVTFPIISSFQNLSEGLRSLIGLSYERINAFILTKQQCGNIYTEMFWRNVLAFPVGKLLRLNDIDQSLNEQLTESVNFFSAVVKRTTGSFEMLSTQCNSSKLQTLSESVTKISTMLMMVSTLSKLDYFLELGSSNTKNFFSIFVDMMLQIVDAHFNAENELINRKAEKEALFQFKVSFYSYRSIILFIY
jgi:hypothetical protein